MNTLWQDIKYGIRLLARNPAFTAVVVFILAIGIGANTTVFSVVNAVLLKPLPYQDADRLVVPWKKNAEGIEFRVSAPDFAFLRQQNRTFASLAGYHGARCYVTGIDRPQEIRPYRVSSCLFDLLGVQPLLGRAFLPEEEKTGNNHVVLLDHAFWKDDMGGAPDIIGKTITLTAREFDSDGHLSLQSAAHTIVGVMPPGFEFPFSSSAPFWLPLDSEHTRMPMSMLARLKNGVTLQKARAEMAVAAEGLKRLNPALNAGITTGVDRLLDRALKGNRRILLLLLGAAGFVLLITCSAVANLFLARAAARRREMATRAALGASRARLLRQTLTESLVVSLAAGLLGLFLTFSTVKGLVALCPADIPRLDETRIDLSVLVFTLAVSMLTGLLFGAVPAWRTAAVGVGQALKEGLTRPRSGYGWRCLRGGLVVAQISISLMLLIGAVLLIRSLIALQGVDLGFQPQDVLAMHIDLPGAKYPKTQHSRAFFDPLLQQTRALPGVRTAALVCPGLDWGTGGGYIDIILERRSPQPGQQPYAKWMAVTPEYFQTMGIELLRGRTFTDQDIRAGGLSAAVIDENLARKYFPDTDPIGQMINHTPIIGVVRTVRDFQVLAPQHDVLYLPLHSSRYFANMDLVVRTERDPMRLAPQLRAQVAALDRDQPVASLQTLDAALAEMLAPRRFTMILLGLFAAIALILAATGIYGLLQYTTAQRTHEIGIRIALGAAKMDVLRAVLTQGLKLILIGLAVGVAGALALTRVLASLLYDVTPTDPLTLACVSLLLAVIAILASYLPARRAARIDPMQALRYE